MTELIDGKKIAFQIEQRIAHAISGIHTRKPGLAYVLVGNNPSSKIYVSRKKKSVLK